MSSYIDRRNINISECIKNLNDNTIKGKGRDELIITISNYYIPTICDFFKKKDSSQLRVLVAKLINNYTNKNKNNQKYKHPLSTVIFCGCRKEFITSLVSY